MEAECLLPEAEQGWCALSFLHLQVSPMPVVPRRLHWKLRWEGTSELQGQTGFLLPAEGPRESTGRRLSWVARPAARGTAVGPLSLLYSGSESGRD